MNKIDTVEQYLELSKRTLSYNFCNVSEEDQVQLHGAIGLATEAIELHQALLAKDDINIAEELGDCAWYTAIFLRGFSDKLDLNILHVIPETVATSDWSDTTKDDLINKLLEFSGFILDQYKRKTFYNKVDEERILDGVKQFYILLQLLTLQFNLTFNQVMEANINKLSKRYPEGYSDYLAVNRDTDVERGTVRSSILDALDDEDPVGEVPESH